jgi:serine/threonine-protein kinase HipA
MRVDALRVSLHFSPGDVVAAGRLAMNGNVALFEYDRDFATAGLSLNPQFPRPGTGLVAPRAPRDFRGVHAVFADSLPDAWGELLLQRRLRPKAVALADLTVLERLAYVGMRGRGALAYAPAEPDPALTDELDIDRLAEEATRIYEGDATAVLRELERLGGSSGGARPKVQIALDDANRAFPGDGPLPAGYSDWIVKFSSSADRFVDTGPLEAAYAETARRAGIAVPRTRLIPSTRGPGYFATERFDRLAGGGRVHMLSIAGMLDADWTIPSIDYDTLIEAVRAATRDDEAVLETFRRMVFNVAVCNRDDHAKQHSLLMDRKGRWHLSPAYDLTFAAGPRNEHYLAVNGRGRDIRRDDVFAVARRQSIALRRADAIVDEVLSGVILLPGIAREFGVTRDTIDAVRAAVDPQVALLR